jgi:hypothetical protein
MRFASTSLGATLVAACLLATSAAAQSCDGLKPIRTTVSVEVDTGPEPEIVASTASTIRERAAKAGRRPTSTGRVATGLTVVEVQGQAGYTLSRLQRPDGTVCVALERVEGELTNRDMTILVDRKYDKSSCEWRAILDHEREHVRINVEALRKNEEAFRRQLEDATRRWQDRWVREDEARAIDRAVGDAVERAVAQVRADADARHQKLDLPSSYDRTQRRCQNW